MIIPELTSLPDKLDTKLLERLDGIAEQSGQSKLVPLHGRLFALQLASTQYSFRGAGRTEKVRERESAGERQETEVRTSRARG